MPRRGWSWLALLAAGLAVAVLLAAMLAGLGSRWGWWPFGTGFSLLRGPVQYGLYLLIFVALVAIFHSRPGTGRRGFPLALVSALLPLVVLVYLFQWRDRAEAAPPIHDITTDTQNPPEFVAIAPLRADAPNPVEYPGEEFATHQRQAYPDIQPLRLDLSPDEAYAVALSAARDMGWEIVAADPAARRIEATDQTFWFGFKDDVVIRLTAADGGTVLDVRSKSRVGRGDVGTNARRIRSYLDRVRAGG
jgi:uncharacterized protein (DUF1499 family)